MARRPRREGWTRIESTAEQIEPDEPTETAQVEVGNSAESTDAGTRDSPDRRKRAYLKERNKVLSAKLEQREATIDELQDRVEALEAELAAFRSSSESNETGCEQSARRVEANDETEQSSVWSRIRSLVGD